MSRARNRRTTKTPNSPRADEFWGVMFLALAGLILAGVFLDTRGVMPVAARKLFGLLGIGAWYLILTLVSWGLKKLQHRPLIPSKLHLFGWISLLPALGGFITGLWMLSGGIGPMEGQTAGPGGSIGWYTWFSLARHLGAYSATILLGGLLLALIGASTNVSIGLLVTRIGEWSIVAVHLALRGLLYLSREIGRVLWYSLSSFHRLIFVLLKDMVSFSLRLIELVQEMHQDPTPSLAGAGSINTPLEAFHGFAAAPEPLAPSLPRAPAQPVPQAKITRTVADTISTFLSFPAKPVPDQSSQPAVTSDSPMPSTRTDMSSREEVAQTLQPEPLMRTQSGWRGSPSGIRIPASQIVPPDEPKDTDSAEFADAPSAAAAADAVHDPCFPDPTEPPRAEDTEPLEQIQAGSDVQDDRVPTDGKVAELTLPAVPEPPPAPAPLGVSNRPADKKKDEFGKLIQIHTAPERARYELPSANLLNPIPGPTPGQETAEELRMKAAWIVETLGQFRIRSEITNIVQGPSVTQFELKPQAGIKLSTISGLSNNLSMALATKSIRIEAPIPGKSVVGIEVPNRKMAAVTFRAIYSHPNYRNNPSPLRFAVGENIAGEPIVGDLQKMPHLLIAGYTGSGKSVAINSILASLLYNATPDELKLILIDPKMVELSVYSGIPHLITDVVTDPQDAPPALKWAVMEMERRYRYLSSFGMRSIQSFNDAVRSGTLEVPNRDVPWPDRPMPFIVIIIDELADLMYVAKREIEEQICRITQMARAVGMHMVVATQRPSVNVITGVIKANLPSRMAFSVASKVDSKVIIDCSGAEKLLGRGDMLYVPVGEMRPQRIQGTYIGDDEVRRLVAECKKYGEPEYTDIVGEVVEKTRSGASDTFHDEMFNECLKLAGDKGEASTSMFQTQLKIGYNRSARIVEEMESRGIVSGRETGKRRKLLIAPQDISNYFIF